MQGVIEPGWESVGAAFRQVLEQDGGAGSAACVYLDGKPVVDVWGGDAGSRQDRVWRRDTAACVFSATKGAASLCVHKLVADGVLDLDEPVARLWPEFAAGGKQDVPLRHLLTHQVGLVSVDRDFTLAEVLDGAPVVRALAQQAPRWTPGTQHGYHALTFGFLVGEVVRRATGRSLGQYFHDEMADPLGLRAWIGLPLDEDVDVALLERRASGPDLVELLLAQDPNGPAAEILRVLTLGGAFPPQLVTNGEGDFNDRKVLAVELPAANMVSDARSLARLYAAAVSTVDGIRLLDDHHAAECIPLRTLDTPVFGAPPQAPRTLDFGLGFLARPMLSEQSFGHPGASGATAFADLGQRIAFAFVPRLMRPESEDSRASSLVAAVKDSLA